MITGIRNNGVVNGVGAGIGTGGNGENTVHQQGIRTGIAPGGPGTARSMGFGLEGV